MDNLRRATEEAGGGHMFWFTTLERARPEAILGEAIWELPGGGEAPQVLI
jgi:hypothetical protein